MAKARATRRNAGKRGGWGTDDDTLMSDSILLQATRAILKLRKVDWEHDVPYEGGCSEDGKTVYLDRHLPATFVYRGRHVEVKPFLVLHETVEKCLLMELGLEYEHAHQLALRVEQAAVRAAGVGWREYNRFTEKYVKEADSEKLTKLPRDLDVKPYRDEKDAAKLREMVRERRRG